LFYNELFLGTNKMKENKLDIYPHLKNVYSKRIESLKVAKISNKNRELLFKWVDYLKASGIGKIRISKLLGQTFKIFSYEEDGKQVFSANLESATIEDITKLVSYINFKDDYSEATKSDYRRWLKQFYRWFEENDLRIDSDEKNVRRDAHKFYTFIRREIKRAYKKDKIDPSTILSDEDINLVVTKGCRTAKERAMIKFLHETGVRCKELLNLKVKHIEFKKNLGFAHVDGKSGKRTVEFVTSMPLMTQYLTNHPNKDDVEGYLWLGENNRFRDRPMIRIGVERLIRRCFDRAGVKKKNNPHWFRHSRASLNAPYWAEVIMCKYFGWVAGSDQLKTYVHLCQKDVDSAFKKMNGIQDEEEVENKNQICGCGMVNDNFQKYCGRCGNPLSVATALQDQDTIKSETNNTIKEMMAMFSNPEMLKAFVEFKRSIIEGD